MVFDKVKELIAVELGIEEETVTLESDLSDDLGADSLDAIELIMAIEEEFEVEISDSEAQKIKRVNDIVSFLENV